jgi:hypothetical protein
MEVVYLLALAFVFMGSLRKLSQQVRQDPVKQEPSLAIIRVLETDDTQSRRVCTLLESDPCQLPIRQ